MRDKGPSIGGPHAPGGWSQVVCHDWMACGLPCLRSQPHLLAETHPSRVLLGAKDPGARHQGTPLLPQQPPSHGKGRHGLQHLCPQWVIVVPANEPDPVGDGKGQGCHRAVHFSRHIWLLLLHSLRLPGKI